MPRSALGLLVTWLFAATVCAAAPRSNKPAAKPAAAPPPDTIAIDLGGVAEEVRTGGAGRYLIFRIKESDKLTVVDVVLGKVVKQIPAPGDFLFAANKDKLVLVLNSQRVIQRWDLKTLEREKSVILPDDRPIRSVSMGPSGNGPLVVWPRGKVEFFDVNTLRPLAVRGEVVNADNGGIWASADGLTFCCWGWTSGPYHLMRLSGITATSVECTLTQTKEGEDYNESWAMPGADGALLIRHGARVLDRELAPIEAGPLNGAALFPTGDPRFLVALRQTVEYRNDKNSVSIVSAADLRVLYTLQEMEPLFDGQIGTQIGRFRVEPRIRYLPPEKLLVTIPNGDKQVMVHAFDLEKALKAKGADYLYVISKPQTRVRPGDQFSYQIEALSNAGGVKYRVEDGPQDLTVSDKGLVNWRVSGDGRVGIIIALSDTSGQETLHSIVLNVVKSGPTVVAADAPDKPARTPPRITTPQPRTDPPAANPVTGQPTTKPAVADGPPPAPPDVIAKLKGVWTATPPLDKARIRASLIKRGVPEAQLNEMVERYVTTYPDFRVVYAFNADGTVVRSYGTDTEPHTVAARWQVVQQSGLDELQIRITGEDATKAETRTITFTDPSHLSMKLSSPVLPLDQPVKFTRGGPPPAQSNAPAAPVPTNKPAKK